MPSPADDNREPEKGAPGKPVGGPPGRPLPWTGRKSSWGWVFWAVLLVALFVYMMVQANTAAPAKIAYSDFKSLVQKGQVSSITVTGQQISGAFKSKQDVVSVAGEKRSGETSFSTVMPTIEDPDLMKTL